MKLRRLIAAGIVVATASFAAAQPALAGKQARPDLQIVDGGIEDFAIPGEKNVIRFSDETENFGYRSAGPSHTGIRFEALPPNDKEFKHKGFERRVRKLKGFVGDSSAKTSKSPKLEFDGLPIGAYRAEICADVRDEVKERNEKNNCVAADRGSRLYLTRRTWTGSLGGSYRRGSGDLRDTWSATDATLELADFEGAGRFAYHFSGTVNWATTGTDAAGCAWSGGAAEAFGGGSEPGDVLIDMDAGEYFGNLASTNLEYATTGQCPTGTRSGLGPEWVDFLSTAAGGAGGRPFPFGAEALTGTSSEGTTTWSWDFR
jgi:hypothetical protein